jgi:hypothetical protein
MRQFRIGPGPVQLLKIADYRSVFSNNAYFGGFEPKYGIKSLEKYP